jgi:NAD(P)-dependent dehydrogenase (short-subunit alcohol dehydrogenase family)
MLGLFLAFYVRNNIDVSTFSKTIFFSVVGHKLIDTFFMYSASKHAVTALTEGLRRALVKQNSKIRVTVSVRYVNKYSVVNQVCPNYEAPRRITR